MSAKILDIGVGLKKWYWCIPDHCEFCDWCFKICKYLIFNAGFFFPPHAGCSGPNLSRSTTCTVTERPCWGTSPSRPPSASTTSLTVRTRMRRMTGRKRVTLRSAWSPELISPPSTEPTKPLSACEKRSCRGCGLLLGCSNKFGVYWALKHILYTLYWFWAAFKWVHMTIYR